MPYAPCKTIVIAMRDSKLSRAQFEEFQKEFSTYHPNVEFSPLFVLTEGDKDKESSLRNKAKTNFFTKELDLLLLQKGCDVCLHSAKDLPEPVEEGLIVAAITKGIDARDVLVTKYPCRWEEIPQQAWIATSSEKREEAVKQKLPQAHFVDIRGTIEERLEKLTHSALFGIVMAEAALLRLNLDLPRLYLEGKTTPMQGKLALLVRKEDTSLFTLFSCMDSR